MQDDEAGQRIKLLKRGERRGEVSCPASPPGRVSWYSIRTANPSALASLARASPDASAKGSLPDLLFLLLLLLLLFLLLLVERGLLQPSHNPTTATVPLSCWRLNSIRTKDTMLDRCGSPCDRVLHTTHVIVSGGGCMGSTH